MTRLIAVCCLFLGFLPASAVAQTYANPAAQSRYAPKPATAQQAQPAQPTAGQPRQVQPQPVYGPQPSAQQSGQQQPVRQASGQEPIRQPMGGAPTGPAAGVGAGPGPAAVGPAVAPLAPVTPLQPSWVPLAPEHEKWVDDILKFWEAQSSKIKTLSCQFTRWEYDPVFGPREQAKTIAKGEIKYGEPDKGLFKVTELLQYAPPAKQGEEAKYVPQEANFGEHWVCDGKRIFEFDARNKRVIERELPPHMQGKAIADGPLPFLFGAKAETIKARYWVRGNENGGNGKYWLDAVPKSRQDAQNFQQVTIVLDEKTFLPEMLLVYAPNYSAKTNPAKTTYQFAKHETTDKNAAGLANLWMIFQGNFAKPSIPFGWKHVVENAGGQAALPPMNGAPK